MSGLRAQTARQPPQRRDETRHRHVSPARLQNMPLTRARSEVESTIPVGSTHSSRLRAAQHRLLSGQQSPSQRRVSSAHQHHSSARDARLAGEADADRGLREYLAGLLRAAEEQLEASAAEENSSGAGRAPSPARLQEVLDGLDCFEAVGELPDACAICLECMGGGQMLARLPCGHCFHNTCIAAWLPASLTCPLCKQPAVA